MVAVATVILSILLFKNHLNALRKAKVFFILFIS